MWIVYYFGIYIFAPVSVQGNTLQLHTSPKKTWDEAFEDCKARGMQLAVLNSQADYDAAVSYAEGIIPGINNVWIGLRMKNANNRVFEWINGEEMQFSPWVSTDPNYFQCDSCVRLFRVITGLKLADKECSLEYAYLCAEIKQAQPSLIEGDCGESVTTAEEAPTTTEVDYTTMTDARATTDRDYTTTTEAYTTTNVDNTTTTDTHNTTDGDYTTTIEARTTTGVVYNTTEEAYITTEAIKTEIEFCLCSCSRVGNWQTYDNYTLEDLKIILAPVTRRLRKILLVNKATLSSYINKHVSKDDSRPSSRQLGYVGILFISLIVVAIIVADMTSFCKIP